MEVGRDTWGTASSQLKVLNLALHQNPLRRLKKKKKDSSDAFNRISGLRGRI